jgi:glucose-6-phosphate 1-epimerase
MTNFTPSLHASGVHTVPGQGGLTRILISNAQSVGELYLHGAHMTRWQPRDSEPVLWLSDSAMFAAAKAIRGGVPLCWPWFGPHPTDANAKAHGFARLNEWRVGGVSHQHDHTAITLHLTSSPATLALWPHDFALALEITAGPTLAVALTTHNTGAAPFTITEALHTYLTVADVGQISIEGLQGARYIDQTRGGAVLMQDGPTVTFVEETDRVYQTSAGCTLIDPVLGRRIHIAKSGSGSTVVWNPWIDKAARLADFGADEWPGMVCIEAANAFAAAVTLAPGASHMIRTEVSVFPL